MILLAYAQALKIDPEACLQKAEMAQRAAQPLTEAHR